MFNIIKIPHFVGVNNLNQSIFALARKTGRMETGDLGTGDLETGDLETKDWETAGLNDHEKGDFEIYPS